MCVIPGGKRGGREGGGPPRSFPLSVSNCLSVFLPIVFVIILVIFNLISASFMYCFQFVFPQYLRLLLSLPPFRLFFLLLLSSCVSIQSACLVVLGSGFCVKMCMSFHLIFISLFFCPIDVSLSVFSGLVVFVCQPCLIALSLSCQSFSLSSLRPIQSCQSIIPQVSLCYHP